MNIPLDLIEAIRYVLAHIQPRNANGFYRQSGII